MRIFILGLLLVSLGCSSLKSRFSKSSVTVSKQEYQDLLEKYNQLLEKVEPKQNKKEEVVGQLRKVPSSQLAETVDVFGKSMVVEKAPEIKQDKTVVKQEIDQQVKAIEKAWDFLKEGKYQDSLKISRELALSSLAQIKVRAQFVTAEVFFAQNEYDVAMQVYEDIIQKHAYSGLVVRSLERLVFCTEKLNLDAKNKEYRSLLEDVFTNKAI